MSIDEAVSQAKKEELLRIGAECDLSLDELGAVLQPIIDSCTKDAISVSS